MTQLKIKNRINNVQMNLLLGLLHSWNLDIEVVQEDTPQSATEKKNSMLSQARGMWADYDIDVKRNRVQTRARRTEQFAL
jgi:hypothetical protein